MFMTPDHLLYYEGIFSSAYQIFHVPSPVRGYVPVIQIWVSKDILVGESEKS